MKVFLQHTLIVYFYSIIPCNKYFVLRRSSFVFRRISEKSFRRREGEERGKTSQSNLTLELLKNNLDHRIFLWNQFHEAAVLTISFFGDVYFWSNDTDIEVFKTYMRRNFAFVFSRAFGSYPMPSTLVRLVSLNFALPVFQVFLGSVA